MIVNRQDRNSYTILLYAVINGYISDDAYEDIVSDYPIFLKQANYPFLRERICGGELKWNDSFVLYIHGVCMRLLVDDLQTVYYIGKRRICEEWLRLFERSLVFLSTDLEFKWSVDESNLLWQATVDTVVTKRTSTGWFARQKLRFGFAPQNEDSQSSRESAPDVRWRFWPFNTEEDYKEALQRLERAFKTR